MNVPEILEELLRLEYPSLLPGHDPDIERYYYLRSRGDARSAMVIYQTRLKSRYPDDNFRLTLLRCYRSRDPSYYRLLALGYRALGERCLERVRKAIAYIAGKVDVYNEKDAYSTIKAAEDILLLFPGDRYEAAAGIERYFRYAQTLNFCLPSMSRAADLIHSYLSQSLSVVEEERNRREEARQLARAGEIQRMVQADLENYLQQKNSGPARGFSIDLSSITFSPEDLTRIEIPQFMSRVEDQTLAYCVKYWRLIEDTAFERILFLYSRKYNRKNYEAFIAIRRGRLHNHRDDEILASVMSVLVTGYYYSIRGDRYLQQQWSVIKLSLEQNFLAASVPSSSVEEAPPSGRAVQAPARRSPVGRTKTGSGKTTAARKKTASGDRIIKKKKKALPALVSKEKKAIVRERREAADTADTARKVQAERAGPENRKTRAALSSLTSASQVKSRASRAAAAIPSAGGSVSDRLRELSGRSYDLYQDRFLAHVRPAIRKNLAAGKGIFFKISEQAENLVYNFLKGHYADPYMNWKDSEERQALAAMGFSLESLIPIIDECYQRF
jgi:hypothetical protein